MKWIKIMPHLPLTINTLFFYFLVLRGAEGVGGGGGGGTDSRCEAAFGEE